MIILQVCDPRVLPAQFHGVSAIRSNEKGISIRFPAAWLSLPINGDVNVIDPASEEVNFDMLAPSGFVGVIASILSKHISDKDLDVDQATALCGYSKSALTRRLVQLDTSIIEILTDLRINDAKEKLANSFLSISGIANSLGYSDATAFSRAFRKYSGQAPSLYRRENKPGATK